MNNASDHFRVSGSRSTTPSAQLSSQSSHKRVITGLLLALPLVLMSHAALGADAEPGNIDAGKSHYTSCAGCHGVMGEGNAALQAPRLAGQFAWYTERQLLNFREGIRGTAEGDLGGALMKPMSLLLPNEQAVADVAAYIESLPR